MGDAVSDIADDWFGFDPPPEPEPPPPPPPPPDPVTVEEDTALPDEDIEDVLRERARKENARRGYSSLIRDDGSTSTPGSSGVNIL